LQCPTCGIKVGPGCAAECWDHRIGACKICSAKQEPEPEPQTALNPKDQYKAETDQLLQAYYRELGSEERPRLKRKASSLNLLSEEPADVAPEQKAMPMAYPCSTRRSEGITKLQMYRAKEQGKPDGVPKRWKPEGGKNLGFERGTCTIERRPHWNQGSSSSRSEPSRTAMHYASEKPLGEVEGTRQIDGSPLGFGVVVVPLLTVIDGSPLGLATQKKSTAHCG
jgi:hypothetical protein